MDLVFTHDHLGTEFDWLARDAEGEVGYFATAGAGPIPASIASNADAFASLQDEVLALPVRTDAVPAIVADWNIAEWLDIARRGLYAFDWRRESGAYVLIARPLQPVRIEQLDTAVARLAVSMSLSFSRSERIAAAGDQSL